MIHTGRQTSTYQDQFEECSLINFQEVGIPGTDVVRPLVFALIIFRRRRVLSVQSKKIANSANGTV